MISLNQLPIETANSFEGVSAIGSLVNETHFLKHNGGTGVEIAGTAGEFIIGTNMTKGDLSVGKKIVIDPIEDHKRYTADIAEIEITPELVGCLFTLSDANSVNGGSASETTGQLMLTEFINPRLGVFKVVNKNKNK